MTEIDGVTHLKLPSGKTFRVTGILGEDGNPYQVIEATDWVEIAKDWAKEPGKLRKPARDGLIDFLGWFAAEGIYAQAYTFLKRTYRAPLPDLLNTIAFLLALLPPTIGASRTISEYYVSMWLAGQLRPVTLDCQASNALDWLVEHTEGEVTRVNASTWHLMPLTKNAIATLTIATSYLLRNIETQPHCPSPSHSAHKTQ